MREEFDDYQQEERQRSLLEAELAPGEVLLWQGAPQGRIRAQGSAFLRMFGIVWLGFSLFWELSALPALFSGNLMGMLFPLFGLPFVGIGVWLAFLLPRRQRRQMESSLYAVTDRRAMVLTTQPSRVVRSLPLEAVRSMEKRVRPDGRGELYFDTASAGYGYEAGYGGDVRGRGAVFAFYGIDADAAQRAVQGRLSALRKGADGNGA